MEKADFIKFCQDTKLLDFTARKCVAKMDMGPKKKEENPNEKVEKCGPIHKYVSIFSDISSIPALCVCCLRHTKEETETKACTKKGKITIYYNLSHKIASPKGVCSAAEPVGWSALI